MGNNFQNYTVEHVQFKQNNIQPKYLEAIRLASRTLL